MKTRRWAKWCTDQVNTGSTRWVDYQKQRMLRRRKITQEWGSSQVVQVNKRQAETAILILCLNLSSAINMWVTWLELRRTRSVHRALLNAKPSIPLLSWNWHQHLVLEEPLSRLDVHILLHGEGGLAESKTKSEKEKD